MAKNARFVTFKILQTGIILLRNYIKSNINNMSTIKMISNVKLPSAYSGLVLFMLVILFPSCKEKFISPAPPITTGYMVVEGVINNGGGETNLKLSRTSDLNTNTNIYEKGAMVKLEGSNNTSWMLFENNVGNYSINNLQLDTAYKYRLVIKTNNNEEYESDFVPVRNNPPIDSISWVRDNKGVTIFINTNDPQNKTRYYQWEYFETWEFHAEFNASLKYVRSGGNIRVELRDSTDPKIFTCWQFNPSTNIVLGSSAKLSRDVIQLPLVNIPPASWKLSVLYSMYVKQYAWSKEGYQFLEKMKKNTESVGSVFDAQPSELNTNFKCISNPNLPVIGFFNICTIREQRIFIYNRELPNWNYRQDCTTIKIENQPDSIRKKGANTLPFSPKSSGPFGNIITFYASQPICVDCTLRGSNLKPVYWP